ncbi:DNA glycosylase [Artemisia annua]|uniref:DNA glycosylase n=1 Tax=Artemisia annua TaxID=35608 RepID=A0A2U1MC73_ARTAN|nr:DNA glycosylase [Artemisia annua]
MGHLAFCFLQMISTSVRPLNTPLTLLYLSSTSKSSELYLWAHLQVKFAKPMWKCLIINGAAHDTKCSSKSFPKHETRHVAEHKRAFFYNMLSLQIMQTEATGVLEGVAGETTQKQQEFCNLSSLPTTRLINMISGTSMFIRAVLGGPLQIVINTKQGPQTLRQNLKHEPLFISARTQAGFSMSFYVHAINFIILHVVLMGRFRPHSGLLKWNSLIQENLWRLIKRVKLIADTDASFLSERDKLGIRLNLNCSYDLTIPGMSELEISVSTTNDSCAKCRSHKEYSITITKDLTNISECKQISQWCWRSCFLSNASSNCIIAGAPTEYKYFGKCEHTCSHCRLIFWHEEREVPLENLNGSKKVEARELCERRNGRRVDLNRNWSVDWGEKKGTMNYDFKDWTHSYDWGERNLRESDTLDQIQTLGNLFENFSPSSVAKFPEDRLLSASQNGSLLLSEQKLHAIVGNADALLKHFVLAKPFDSLLLCCHCDISEITLITILISQLKKKSLLSGICRRGRSYNWLRSVCRLGVKVQLNNLMIQLQKARRLKILEIWITHLGSFRCHGYLIFVKVFKLPNISSIISKWN